MAVDSQIASKSKDGDVPRYGLRSGKSQGDVPPSRLPLTSEDNEDEDEGEETKDDSPYCPGHAEATLDNLGGLSSDAPPPEQFNYLTEGDQNIISLDPHDVDFQADVSQTMDWIDETTSVHTSWEVPRSLTPVKRVHMYLH